MKTYQVSVLRDGVYVFGFFVNHVSLREREVQVDRPFPVVEFLRNGNVVAEFYPDNHFSYDIKVVDI